MEPKAHEIKNQLNFVNNFSGVSVELIDELRETLDDLGLDRKARTQIAELTDTQRDNLQDRAARRARTRLRHHRHPRRRSFLCRS